MTTKETEYDNDNFKYFTRKYVGYSVSVWSLLRFSCTRTHAKNARVRVQSKRIRIESAATACYCFQRRGVPTRQAYAHASITKRIYDY